MKKILFGGVVALAALVASCSTDDQADTVTGGEASVVVRIAAGTRAELPAEPGEEVQEAENIVRSFTAYVFNYTTGRLEAKASGDAGATSVRIANLNSASQKTIVVTANTDVDIAVGGNYSEFESKLMDLDNEPHSYEEVRQSGSKGFAMFGRTAPVTLAEGDDNTETVSLERLVAKVTLGKLMVKIQTDEDADDYLGFNETHLENFFITGVSMQKVVGRAGFLGQNSGVLYGGLTGDGLASTVQKTYLYDNDWNYAFTNGEQKTLGNYFYVMPSDGGAAGDYTMMTVVASFYGEEVYFPVVINRDREESQSVGKIDNNTWYTLDLTIKDLNGSMDPETPKGEASLEVTVKVLDWDVLPAQEEEW
ncbi:MAG: fimbrial protein [Alistipes sp.]|nr:fimbrial protein [Alistipes sp.]